MIDPGERWRARAVSTVAGASCVRSKSKRQICLPHRCRSLTLRKLVELAYALTGLAIPWFSGKWSVAIALLRAP